MIEQREEERANNSDKRNLAEARRKRRRNFREMERGDDTLDEAVHVRDARDIPTRVDEMSNKRYVIHAENAVVVQRSDGSYTSQLIATPHFTKVLKGDMRNIWKAKPSGKFVLVGVLIDEYKYFRIPQLSEQKKVGDSVALA